MATPPVRDDEPTLGRLVHDASKDISSLISQEIRLAKSELKISVTNAGVGVGFFAGAAFLGVLAIIMLSIALAFLIHWNGSGLALQWAFLVVMGFYLLLAGLLAFLGLKKVKKVRGPEKAIEQGKEIPKALRGKA